MSQDDIPKEIDEALRIARDTRNSVLSGKGILLSNLRGFLTVAQILGRKNDLEWVESELDGYDKLPMPKFRLNCMVEVYYGRNLYGGHVEVANFPISMGIPQIESIIKLKNKLQGTRVTPKKFLSSIIQSMQNIPQKGFKSIFMVNNTEFSNIIAAAETELIKKLNNMISEITYGKIPQNIFKEFQDNVNRKLSDSNPEAISALNKAYESLGGSHDTERISQVSLACRRLIKHVADEVYPAKSEKYVLKIDNTTVDLSIGTDNVLNRLTAYVDSLNSHNKQHILDEIRVLHGFYHGEEGFVNKGIHGEITNSEAKRLVLYTYLILGDIILLKQNQ